ncbi:MAG: hypothetical protein MJ099_03320 [Clostridia bacterium]|nr:hypothetical protein [Clostridia bacterium]
MQKIIAILLTVVFLAALVSFGLYGLLTNTENIRLSIGFSRAITYLTNKVNPGFFEMTTARINSLQTALGDSILFKSELGDLNAAYQRMLGKDIISAGSEDMYIFPDGQIAALTTRTTLAAEAEEVNALIEALGDTPKFFSFVTPQIYDGGSAFPEGVDAIDTGDVLAEEVLGIVGESGIRTLDSRTFFADYDYSVDDIFLSTDMHWTNLAALLVARRYAETLNEVADLGLDSDLLAVENFTVESHPQLFLGEYGQALGKGISGLDDIDLYIPNFETSLSRYTNVKFDIEESAEGDYDAAIIRRGTLEPAAKGENVVAYSACGLIEKLEVIDNHSEDCADCTVLIFRDSYTAPVGNFLSLLCRRVVMVDPRRADKPMMDYVAEYNPDAVIISFSRQLMEDHRYTLN